MGTRGLTVVVHDGTHRIAQYGQWDHYPSGQGVTALEFCRKWLTKPEKESQFVSNLELVRFANEEDERAAKEFAESIGSKDGWMNMEQVEKWHARYPLWSRDHGAMILHIIAEPPPGVDLLLQDQYEFAADSLFCEYAYVVDLDARKLEVYKGFNHATPKGRFATLKVDPPEHRKGKPYLPVTLIAEFELGNLPSSKAFLEVCESRDKDDEE